MAVEAIEVRTVVGAITVTKNPTTRAVRADARTKGLVRIILEARADGQVPNTMKMVPTILGAKAGGLVRNTVEVEDRVARIILEAKADDLAPSTVRAGDRVLEDPPCTMRSPITVTKTTRDCRIHRGLPVDPIGPHHPEVVVVDVPEQVRIVKSPMRRKKTTRTRPIRHHPLTKEIAKAH